MVGRLGIRALAFAAALCATACTGFDYQIQWDSRDQIWLSEESQVKVRAAQTRVFDGSDPRPMLEAIVATFQDAGFQIEVLDEVLGIVSGKKFASRGLVGDASYFVYDEDSLVLFSRSQIYRSWGPFWHREDLVRLTVTVRRRNEQQLLVRAAAQTELVPLESSDAYQEFFRALEQTLFVQRAAEGGA